MKDLNIKYLLVIVLIIVFGATAARMLLVRSPVALPVRHEVPAAPEPKSLASQPPATGPVTAAEPTTQKIANIETPPPPPETKRPTLAGTQPVVPPPPAQRNNRQDPLARVALQYVGADPYAEAYWMDAIFDPNLSDREREDLMEDLNEEGLSNPKQPGPEDLSLIMNRIQIIEDVAPQADAFMMEHLWEAYKDLVNLANGRPPQ